MRQDLVGKVLATGVVVLLGIGGIVGPGRATGDPSAPPRPGSGSPDALAARIAQLESAKIQAEARVAALEQRIAALEKKIAALIAGPAIAAAPAAPAGSTTAPDASAMPAAAGEDEAAVALKRAILGLTTGNFKEVRNLTNLWVSPLEQTPADELQLRPPKFQVLATGKLRYVGSEDLSGFDLKLQLIYHNRDTNKVIGLSELTVQGQLLKPDRYYTFHATTPLTESYINGDPTDVVLLKQTKTGASR